MNTDPNQTQDPGQTPEAPPSKSSTVFAITALVLMLLGVLIFSYRDLVSLAPATQVGAVGIVSIGIGVVILVIIFMRDGKMTLGESVRGILEIFRHF